MRKLFVFILTISFFISCQKEKSPVLSELKGNHYPLKVGNYWVYQHIFIDTSGNEKISTFVDSVVISRDTTILGLQYFILEGALDPWDRDWVIMDILRDSAGYIVNDKGIIRLAESNFIDTLARKIFIVNEDTIYTLTYKMEKLNNTITVPAGTFDVFNYRGTVYTPKKQPNIPNPRYINTYYADSVGKTLETYFFLGIPTINEKRLVRYKIQD